MNISDIRSSSTQELLKFVEAARKDYVNLIFQKKKGDCSNTSRFHLMKRSIARILTVLNERKKEEKNA